MNKIRVSIFCLVVLFIVAPMLCARDLSQYRAFSLGTNLAHVLKHTEQKLADVKVIRSRPALIQELAWRPVNLSATALRLDSVEQILFSFYNGELYKMSVTYASSSIEGLTADDIVTAISTKYGAATIIAVAIDAPTGEGLQPVASWDNSQYSVKLMRSSFTGGFELAIYFKRINAEAELALAEAVKLENQEAPQQEAERLKKETDDLEVTRQKNHKSFRP
jgi:hypothetical protein